MHAFLKSSGAAAYKWPTTPGTFGNLSAPSFGADGTIYFTDDGNHELVPLTISANTPSLASQWTSTFQGSAAVTPSTIIDSVGTEPTIDSNGVLYFGTAGGNVYALITESTGPLAPTAGSTWPRVGYDNCNSSNTAFICQ